MGAVRNKLAAVVLLGVGLLCRSWGETLTILASGDGKTGATLTTTDRAPDPAHAGAFKGTGSIVLKLAGITLPQIGPMPYSGLLVAGPHVMGGVLTTSKDEKAGNVFGTGLDLDLAKGSSISIGGSPVTLTLGGAVTIAAPFKDQNGNSLKATVSQFSVNTQGAASAKASLAITKPLELPGVAINSGSFSLSLTVPAGGNPAVSWACPMAGVSISLPGVTTNDSHSINLEATNVNFDADGLLSFQATYRSPQPITVSLAQPSNFTLSITYASVTMVKSTITAGDFRGSVTLPPIFSSNDKASGSADPATINNVDVKVNSNGAVVSAGSGAIDLYWNGFHLNIPASGGQPNFILDLSDRDAVAGEMSPDGTALPASWQGLFVRDASLTFPQSFGSGAKMAVQNLLVESGGLSGKFTASGAALSGFTPPGFPGKLSSLSLTFLKSQVADFDGKGVISVGGDVGDIGVEVGCSEAGVFSITLNQSTPVNFGPLGVQLQIDQGTFTYDKSGTESLKITGSLSVPSNASGPMTFLKGAAFAVKDLTVDSHGKLTLTSAWLDLPHPATVDIGPVNLVLSQIGIGQDAQQRPTVMLTGDVAISELPISGQIGFKGLTISAGPSVDFGDISLKASVAGVATIEAELSHDHFDGNTVAAAYPAWRGKSEDIYRGSASLELDCFGPSAPFGGSLQFMVAKTGWYVIGSAEIGTGIQLGPTPLSLFAFEGGFGHNVMPDTPGATGVPGQDYQLIPYAPGQSGTEWMLLAGVRLGTSDYFTAWGDLVLSLMFGDTLIVDLDGKLELLTAGAGYPMGSDLPQDRLVHANIHYDAPSSTFRASVSADLNFPSKAQSFIEAIGSMDFLLSPNDKHLYLGGPITFGDPPYIQNPITVKVMGIQGPSAAFDADLSNSSFSARVASIVGFSGNWSLNLDIFSIGVSVSAQEWFQAGIAFNTHPFALQSATIGLGVSASANLNFSCWLGSASFGAGVNGDLNGTIDSSYKINVSGDLDVNCHVCGVGLSVPIHFSLP
ncbi:MAG: hypothetical protein ACYC96_02560 [Fimbriimonadaceae bacterium]